MADSQVKQNIVWSPQIGPQYALIKAPHPLIGFGGARGGGKTDGVLGKFGIRALKYGKKYNAVFFRQEMPQADDLIDRAKDIYIPLGAEWGAQQRIFVFPSGARIRFRPLENNDDAQKYQGQNLTDAAVEEAGNYPSYEPIFKLFGALRSVGGIPIQLILTFNPGGAGHKWIKDLFWSPCPTGNKTLYKTLPNGKRIPYVFIPSKVGDNRILQIKDPGFVDRLHLVGSPELVRAWLEGDFTITEGSYFPEFGQRHIVAPFPIPKHWPRYFGYDWGFRSPFACVWGAVSSGKDDSGKESPIPKGAIVIYRELHGKQVSNEDQGAAIARAGSEDPEGLHAVADPAIFSNQGGPSIADQINVVLVKSKFPKLRPADNDRLSGWAQIRSRLIANPAMLYVTTACPYLIESLPAAQMDERHPEDMDTTGDDHILDALRYLCKERLLDATYKKEVESVKGGRIHLQQYINEVRRAAARTQI